MTVKLLYEKGLKILKQNNIENFIFDCDCLFEFATGFNKINRILKSDQTIDNANVERFLSSVNRRVGGEPLQYIIGKWEFMGFEFSVGKGVLIPRPETELLVEKANEYIKKINAKVVYDLCAGSGAIGLSIAKMNPECKVILFEKYDQAFSYLIKNANDLKLENVEIIKQDIFCDVSSDIPAPDLILSNPPYINTDEIPFLQNEVKHEPVTALDGGNDGLDFYLCIYEKWFELLNENGCILLECGEGQAIDIIDIFVGKSTSSKIYDDFNNIDRVVQIIV